MRLTRQELYYYIGTTMQFIMTAFLITAQKIPYSIVLVIGIIIFLGLKILMTSYSKNEIIIIAGLLLVSAITYIYQDDSKILRISLLFIAAKDIPVKRFMKYLLAAYLVLFIYVPIMCIFAEKGKISMYGTFGIGRQAATRYMLGFDGPNRLSGVWLCLLATTYLVLEKRKFLIDIIFFVLSCGLYYLNRSRTGLVAVTVLIFTPYIYRYGSRFVKKIIHEKILLWTFIVIISLTIGATLAYGSFMDKLNVVFNNRMSYLAKVYINEKITLWGSDLNFQTYGGGMDNSYFAVLYTNGLIPTVIYAIAILKYINLVKKKNNIKEIPIALSFILVAYVQEMIDVPFINYMLILFSINWHDMMTKKGNKRLVRSWNNVNSKNMQKSYKIDIA